MCRNAAKSDLFSCFSPHSDMFLFKSFLPDIFPVYFNYYQNIGFPGFCLYIVLKFIKQKILNILNGHVRYYDSIFLPFCMDLL